MSEFSKITCGEIENTLRDIPGDIEAISRLLRGTAGMERINAKAMALLLAAGADGEFAGDGPGWLVWARKETGLAESTLYHRLAAGRVLRQFQGKAVIYRHLLDWEIEKIYTLAKLPEESREGFLAKTEDVWTLDREELRYAAYCYLARLKGRPEPERKDRNASPALPGFEAMIDTLDEMEDDEYLREIEARPEKAHMAGEVGIALLDAYMTTLSRTTGTDITANLLPIQEILAEKQKEVAEMLRAIQGETHEETTDPGVACNSASAAEQSARSASGQDRTDKSYDGESESGVACDTPRRGAEQCPAPLGHGGQALHD